MQSIEDNANESIIHSLALTSLIHRRQHNYPALLNISTSFLQQRVQYLNPRTVEEWEKALQWQEDSSANAIQTLWSEETQEELDHSCVYYLRMDPETCHAVIEFARNSLGSRFVVVLAMVGESPADGQEWKYHNTREISAEEWEREILSVWCDEFEEAERRYYHAVALRANVISEAKEVGEEKQNKSEQDADEYWGKDNWSSGEEKNKESETEKEIKKENGNEDVVGELPLPPKPSTTTKPKKKRFHISTTSTSQNNSSDGEDDTYWDKFSQNPPGNRTPPVTTPQSSKFPSRPVSNRRITELSHSLSRTPSKVRLEQQEVEEEYDMSYNPLFTVPSVPSLPDLQSQAIADLTTLLQDSLPYGKKPPHSRRERGVRPFSEVQKISKSETEPSENPPPPTVTVAPVSPSVPEKPLSQMENNTTNLEPPDSPTTTNRPRRNSIFDHLASLASILLPILSPSHQDSNSSKSDSPVPGSYPVDEDEGRKEAARVHVKDALNGVIGLARMNGLTGWEVKEILDEIVLDG